MSMNTFMNTSLARDLLDRWKNSWRASTRICPTESLHPSAHPITRSRLLLNMAHSALSTAFGVLLPPNPNGIQKSIS